MYSDVITLFNRHKSASGDMWYPTVISGVNLQMDKAAIVAKFGAESKDNAVLSVHYQVVNGKMIVDGKEYLPPKEWKAQTEATLEETLTFANDEEDFDFFMLGVYKTTDVIADEDYEEGLYDYLNRTCDYVFAISSVGGPYSAIPTFQIMGT